MAEKLVKLEKRWLAIRLENQRKAKLEKRWLTIRQIITANK